MGKTTVVNMLRSEYDVYIGRPGRGLAGTFGNPFKVGKDGSREEVIEKFRVYFKDRIEKDPAYKKAVEALRGKRLGCFCAPLSCHGTVYVEYLEKGPS